ncbi:MAG: dTDP-glucose 4,6-dehydratase [Treponema sp. GWB1_62_6]|nr:MAG: dTDP-glucose 4,6-dehydratase [Treponema sp. GWA1_62_8]OHE62637.1 MAG: dTDP-glucose 4,6-dehydratase [Treponema sp. GWB1_62_6]OHE65009.1 MAG: dTDP-glucose 4,6-dehydratase [Treponema sp. GWC1_61_84]HCM26022.1 dTDP-glucose 4,6-dehydratase [Treponema sp.]
MRSFNTILVTGGAGFIGANFIHYLFSRPDFQGKIINLDVLTYAGNLESLDDIEKTHGGKRYFFERADICDRAAVEAIFAKHAPDAVVHFAAESHVDRSILGPEAFVKTNVMGTFTMLDVARNAWKGREDVLFHHVSTDEVFGSLGETGYFTEKTPYDPRSPYSAAKAGSDHLVMAYSHTFGLPVTLTNCSNNYGPYQFPEKLIPVMILNMVEGKPLPVYGDGRNIRDWLYVEDHNSAVWTVMTKGKPGETYNIGGENEWENIKLLKELMASVARHTGKNLADYEKLITYVKDRPGHDRRYAIDCSKLKKELGWKQSFTFDQGLDRTVAWYLENTKWIEDVRSGAYRDWIKKNYGER